MNKEIKKKLDGIIEDFSFFLGKEYSSQFKNLTTKEDRHLFYLAKVLVQLKHISEDLKQEEKIISFPTLIKTT